MSEHPRRSNRNSLSNGQPSLPMEAIVSENAGKWVLIHVTEYDENGWPSQGSVIKCAASRKKLTNLLLEKAKSKDLKIPYYLFKAIPRGRTVGEWRNILAKPGIENVDA